MEFQVVKFHFRAPVMLSKGSVDYTDIDQTLHSDTLKNALFVCALQLFGKEAINHEFFHQFTISSAFPFFENEFFFPKPFVRLPFEFEGQTEPYHYAKKVKKLLWLGKSVFEAVCRAETVTIKNGQFSENNRFLSRQLTHLNRRSVVLTEEQQRVKINYAADSEPYYASRIRFEPGAGFYVLLQSDATFFSKILKPAFRLLGENGLGSYKNLGNGFFEPEFSNSPLILSLPARPNAWVALSLYCPHKEEITTSLLQQSHYQLIKRGGYLASPENVRFMSWRKKSVYMFQEGSVFPASDKPKGKLADVTPSGLPHPVYRDGQALFFPLTIPTP
ncbi:MAG: type III-A CRISPR-associated RAMP protein Csm4 [Cyclobacteriaceae bacterium]|nr:type III-A CRISPR-associated RAMP protein Csm4 [Cyclobacteriaceae bacterium]